MTAKPAESQGDEQGSKPIAARVSLGLVTAIDQWARAQRMRTGDNISQSRAISLLLAQALGTDEQGAPLTRKRKAAAK